MFWWNSVLAIGVQRLTQGDELPSVSWMKSG
jgi:hypothetical protein